jgi:hypothetical protein
MMTSVSFTGKFSPNFDLKNMVLTYTKEFFMGKKIKLICQNLKKIIFKLPDFYDKFQYVAMNFLNSILFSTIFSAPDASMGEIQVLFRHQKQRSSPLGSSLP